MWSIDFFITLCAPQWIALNATVAYIAKPRKLYKNFVRVVRALTLPTERTNEILLCACPHPVEREGKRKL